MRVICNSTSRITKEGTYDALSIGKEYVVLAIEFYNMATSEFSKAIGDYILYRIKDNDGIVIPYPSKLFDIISGKQASCWICYNKDCDSYSILPSSWARISFWDDYYNDDYHAVEEFVNAEKVILSEELDDSIN